MDPPGHSKPSFQVKGAISGERDGQRLPVAFSRLPAFGPEFRHPHAASAASIPSASAISTMKMDLWSALEEVGCALPANTTPTLLSRSRTIVAGKDLEARVPHSETIQLSNACLSVDQDPDAKGRCVLQFAEKGRTLVAVSSFNSPYCEQDILNITLDAGRTYIFSVEGEFAVDIMGHKFPSPQQHRTQDASTSHQPRLHPGSQADTARTGNDTDASSSTGKRRLACEPDSAVPTKKRKKSAHEDFSAEKSSKRKQGKVPTPTQASLCLTSITLRNPPVFREDTSYRHACPLSQTSRPQLLQLWPSIPNPDRPSWPIQWSNENAHPPAKPRKPKTDPATSCKETDLAPVFLVPALLMAKGNLLRRKNDEDEDPESRPAPKPTPVQLQGVSFDVRPPSHDSASDTEKRRRYAWP
ncbi:hypothetical protein NMY22_g4646 [Coprinellus aureogranulatus]|nr:hypothetical protein NMY22_g4646 [Coprinellus aureogranulatus]